jgi:hypothetical protein
MCVPWNHVTIDLSASYAKTVREALPGAVLVADRYHLVALANDMLTQVRQRVIRETQGRRGRKNDPAARATRPGRNDGPAAHVNEMLTEQPIPLPMQENTAGRRTLSQAECAGPIPVTRSTGERHCSTVELEALVLYESGY